MDITQVRRALEHEGQRPQGNAVVVALVSGEQGLQVVLEVRAASLPVQPGEVCLPGGHIEEGELPYDAALRETCEELLIEPWQFQLIGSLGVVEGPGGQPLHVFVALLSEYEGTFSPAEVERTFCLPLDWLIQHAPTTYHVNYVPQFPDNFPWSLVTNGRAYRWRSRAHDVPFYEGTDPVVWGATARVLEQFANRLRQGQREPVNREQLVIRLADDTDLAAVIQLYHEVSNAMIGKLYDCCWRRGGHPSDEFITQLVVERGMLVAAEGDRIIGAVGIDHDLGHRYVLSPWLANLPDEQIGVIHLLTVHPDYRGRGISRLLLRACIEEARERGLSCVRLDVTDNNLPAQRLYQSEGFVVIGSGIQEIGPADRPLVRLDVMQLDL